jgi:hypothetical protein
MEVHKFTCKAQGKEKEGKEKEEKGRRPWQG